MAEGSSIEPGDICLDCGICCGYPMFSHVELTNADRDRLEAGEYSELAKLERFEFPCPNQCSAACGIYHSRPQTCRDYRCKTLAAAQCGKLPVSQARETVRGVAELYRKFLETIPSDMDPKDVRDAIADNQCPPELNSAGFQAMRLAFVALQVAIDRHIRSKDDALVQSAMK